MIALTSGVAIRIGDGSPTGWRTTGAVRSIVGRTRLRRQPREQQVLVERTRDLRKDFHAVSYGRARPAVAVIRL
jgi:hypothetical protein